MKKFLIFAAAFFAATMISCQQEPVAPADPEEDVFFPETIIATTGDNDTKAGMDRYYDDGTSSYKYRHHWESGDVIYVYKGTTRNTYNCTNAATGEFTLDGSKEVTGLGTSYAQYCAIFNSMEGLIEPGRSYGGSDNEIRVGSANFPTSSELLYTSTSVTPGYGNIMAACSDDGTYYRFTSLVGWLKLQLKGPKTVQSLTLNADYSHPIGHTIDVTFPTSGTDIGVPVYNDVMDEDAIASLTVTLDKPVALNLSTATDFYIALPPLTRPLTAGITIDFSDGSSTILTSSKTITITANAVTPMAAIEAGVITSSFTNGLGFNVALKNYVTGADDKTYTSEDNLIKGIELSLGEASPTVTTCNLAKGPSYAPIYASFNDGTGIVTLHTAAHRVTLDHDCRSMFQSMQELESIDLLSQVELSQVGIGSGTTGVKDMFRGCAKLTGVDLSKMDFSQLTTCNSMFYGCSSLASIDVSTMNTQYVTEFTSMFTNCSSLVSIDISNFQTERARYFNQMFKGCSALETLELGAHFFQNGKGSYDYNDGIRSLQEFVSGCTSLESLHLTAGPYGSMLHYSPYGADWALICYGCTALTSFVNEIGGYTSDFQGAFDGCVNLETVDLGTSLQDFTGPWNFKSMFRNCRKLRTLKTARVAFVPLYSAAGAENDNNKYFFQNTCADSAGLDLYVNSASVATALAYYYNATMSADGFVTVHLP
ncbi:MAG: BspA family leucine-rich repeat surface protein [Bacteroidales bacterium]|nr:BspA family leucine-rich repeat surface protein [Bacteroidales bacterium]